MEVEFSALTDVGRVRAGNEDNFLVDRKLQLYVVCDGMGGHQAGAVASATAVNVVRETIAKSRGTLVSFERGDGTAGERDILALLQQAVQTANARIYERGRSNPGQRGMGTTLSLALLCGDHVFLGHVGDSRVYRRRGTETQQLTRDHSLLEEIKTQQPEIKPNVFDERLRNAITRALGGAPTIDVDVASHPVSPGDVYMLCTDGLYGYFDTIDAHAYLGAQDLDATVKDLIHDANDRGGQDNITVVLIRIPEDAEARTAKRSPLLPELQRVSELEHLAHEQLRAIVREGEERCFAPGEVVAESATDADGFWILVSGQVSSETRSGETKRLLRGNLLSIEAFVTGRKHRVRMVASGEEEARTIYINRGLYHSWAAEKPDLALRLAHAMLRAQGQKTGLGAARVSDTDLTLDPESWHASAEQAPAGTGVEELDPGLLTPDAGAKATAGQTRKGAPPPPPPAQGLSASQLRSDSDNTDPR